LLHRYGLDHLIEALHVVAPAEAASAKADILRKLKPKAWCGDSEVDAEAGRLAGVPFFAVTCGQRNAQVLQALPHVDLLADIRDLGDRLVAHGLVCDQCQVRNVDRKAESQ
ncbi:MAG: HAD family hydrolase, partial [Thermaurantiacus sp.]